MQKWRTYQPQHWCAHGLNQDIRMSCQKGKPIRKAKPGDFRCKDCGVVSAKKKKLCQPKKVK
jgi:hypothetical protein